MVRAAKFSLGFAVVLLAGGLAAGDLAAREIDPSKIACAEFLASTQDVKASLISWLRGYHAGKSGASRYDSAAPYGARLGRYCHDYPAANLIEVSERILAEFDRGI